LVAGAHRVAVSTSSRSPALASSKLPSDMNTSTGGPVLTFLSASHLSNQACSAYVHWMPRRVGQQPEPWSHWPIQALSRLPRPRLWRVLNQSAAVIRAALSFTPCTRKTGIGARITPLRQSRSACQA
jgi:hypothetical protein